MTTVLIVDDHPAVRMVLKTQVSQLLGVTSVEEADNGQTAIDMVRQSMPDLVILDLDIPKLSGLEVISRLKAIHPGIRILVLSAQDPQAFAPRAMQAGARAFVSKMQDVSEIMRCLEAVMAGYTLLPSGIDHEPVAPGRMADEKHLLERLTDKEILVLQMLAKGMSNREIGDALFISNKTVSSHKMRIMGKLKVATYLELVDFARRCQVVA